MWNLRCTIYVFVIVIIVSLNASAQDNDIPMMVDGLLTGDGKCEDAPTDLIRVTVQQISKKEPAYVFLLTNLSELPIFGLIVGEGKMYDSKRFRGSKWNDPIKMEAPTGWRAMALDGVRSYYLWQIEDVTVKEKMILPDKSSSDFRIYLPEDTRKEIGFYTDGVPAIQEKFKDLPFKVSQHGGFCLWGIIKTVDYIE